MVLAGGVALAAIPDSGTAVFHGCYSTKTGAVRLIDPSKGQKCASTQKAVTWGQPGVTWRGSWRSATSYQAQDAVAYQGSSYLAIKASKGIAPASGTADLGAARRERQHRQERPGQVLSDSKYGFSGPDGITYDGSHVWVTNNSGTSVTEINASDGSLAQILSGASYDFNGPAEITWADKHLWVVNENGNSVTAVQR